VSGHPAAAPPSSVMNSRRLMPDIGLSPALAPPVGPPHAQPCRIRAGKSSGQT
jgi:hypothetical protein